MSGSWDSWDYSWTVGQWSGQIFVEVGTGPYSLLPVIQPNQVVRIDGLFLVIDYVWADDNVSAEICVGDVDDYFPVLACCGFPSDVYTPAGYPNKISALLETPFFFNGPQMFLRSESSSGLGASSSAGCTVFYSTAFIPGT